MRCLIWPWTHPSDFGTSEWMDGQPERLGTNTQCNLSGIPSQRNVPKSRANDTATPGLFSSQRQDCRGSLPDWSEGIARVLRPSLLWRPGQAPQPFVKLRTKLTKQCHTDSWGVLPPLNRALDPLGTWAISWLHWNVFHGFLFLYEKKTKVSRCDTSLTTAANGTV